MTDRAEKAVEYKHSGYNCCQAVIKALSGNDELIKTGAGFAVGMGNMSATCGALIGAVIAAGEKTDGKKTVAAAKMINSEFRERCGALICHELKGIETGNVLCECDDCVRNAVRAYENIMNRITEQA